MKVYSIFLVLTLAFLSASCLKDKAIPANVASGECDGIVSYSEDIRPIIEASCNTGLGDGSGCHDAWIDSYSSIKSQLNGGAWQSQVFLQRTMPKIPNNFGIDSLTNEAWQMMKCWVDQEYPNN